MHMLFEKIKRSSRLHEIIANTIEERIISGELKPGDTLPSEGELMQQLGTGRYTVREALRVLETNGLITVRHGSRKGPVITRPSNILVSDFLRKAFSIGGVSREHINQFRLGLESSIVESLSLTTLNDEWCARIEQNIDETKKTYDDDGDIMLLNAQFHVLLAQATENPVYAILINTFFDNPQIMEIIAPFRDALSVATIDYHERIFQAIKAGDGDQARVLMKQHIVQIDEVWKKRDSISAETVDNPAPSD
jgi:GntR family transcriptional regulator, transcriptional repressor for pyruvate dehydrogenase complex